MSETGTYEFEDIQRYLQHKMSAQEMHAFEKAMMDDPFLADAIEGYKKSNEQVSTTHLSDIERQLTEGKQKARVVAMPLHKNSWWKIAAIVLIIVTGAAISYQLLKNSPKDLTKEIAATKQQSLPIATDSTATNPEAPANNKAIAQQQTGISRDNVALNYKRKESTNRNEVTQSSPSLQLNEVTRQSANDVGRIDNETLSKKEQSTAFAPSAVRDSGEISIASRSMMIRDDTVRQALQGRVAGVDVTAFKKESKAAKQNEFKGKVTDAKGTPVPYATVRDTRASQATTADKQGNFIVKAPDTTVQVEVNSAGFAGATARLNNSSKDNNIVLQENKNKLDEVVVVGYGTKRKKDVVGTVYRIKSETVAEPEGGWDNFNNYANRQIKNFKDSTGHAFTGDVNIEFNIDRKDRPKNIKIQQQVDKAVIQKAKDILQQGPSWIGNKGSNIKLVLHF